MMSSNLWQRIISAVILIPLALGIFYAGGWLLLLVIALLGAVMLHEWTSMTEGAAVRSLLILQVMSLGGALLLAAYGWPERALLFTAIAALVVAAQARLTGRKPLWALLGTLYVVIPCVSILWLRGDSLLGFGWTVWCLLLVWGTDIGGYIAGKSIGGPKLAPRISPNKTWVGLLGGVTLAALASLAAGYGFSLPVSTLGLLQAGAGLAIWAQIGDLCESAVKRRFGVKDSGSLIPGHGGILDRVDGLVFVVPVVALVVTRL